MKEQLNSQISRNTGTVKYGIGIQTTYPEFTAPFVLPQYDIEHTDVSVLPLAEFSHLVDFTTIKVALEQHQPKPDDLLSAFSFLESMTSEGLFIEVKNGSQQLRLNAVGDGQFADMVVIVVRKNSRLFLNEQFSVTGSMCRSAVVYLEEGAHLHWASVTTSTPKNLILGHAAILSANAEVTLGDSLHAESFQKVETQFFLDGEQSHAYAYQFLRTQDKAHSDIETRAHLHANGTYAHINALGFAYDASKLLYRGFIDIKKDVRDVDGAQEGKFLILSPQAEIDAIPTLDIESNAVHCSHRVSISPLTDAELFYPQLRGLEIDEARNELLHGNIASRLACIKHAGLRDTLEKHIT